MEFRLITEVEASEPQPSLSIESRRWALSQALDLSADVACPPFACISYVWGPHREPHAFDASLFMSTRTRPALATAIRVSECSAFWTDVFCIPQDGPPRQSTLENMGYIYSRAAEVIVVLGEDVFSVIEEMVRDSTISEAQLYILERDEWISSVWTYQEVVNGRFVRFVSTTHTDKTAAIKCTEFFSALGASLMQLQNAKGIETFETVKMFPNVSALEEILADWQTSAYTFRSALRIFSSMSRKRNKNAANYYYAILGAITDTSQELVWDPDQNLAEKVMSVCEQKNDFSFIYTIAAREPDPKRCWRPQSEFVFGDAGDIPPVLRPILAWHCWGDAQHGYYDHDGRLWLHETIVMRPAVLMRNEGMAAVSRWLQRDVKGLDNDALENAALTAIEGMGFQGSPNPLVVDDGLCFAILPVQRNDVVRVLTSGQIRWPMGAPGLVHLDGNSGKQYVPCVFVGEIIETQSSPASVLL